MNNNEGCRPVGRGRRGQLDRQTPKVCSHGLHSVDS